jgi:hypothetical protein
MDIKSLLIGIIAGIVLSDSFFVHAVCRYLRRRIVRRHTPVVTSFSILGVHLEWMSHLSFGVYQMNVAPGQVVHLSVINVKAGENAVDLAQFPSALTGLVWSVDPAQGSVNTTQPDGLKADFVGSVEGDVVITATGKNVAGSDVVATFVATVAVPVPVVTSFEIDGATDPAA